MDWSKIEKNVQFHTTARLQTTGVSDRVCDRVSGRVSARGYNPTATLTHYEEDIDTSHFYGTSQLEDRVSERVSDENNENNHNYPNISHSSSDNLTTSLIQNDIHDMKATIMKQNEKIELLEMEIHQKKMSEKNTIENRMNNMEKEIQNCTKYIQNISQESNDLNIQSKAYNGRLSFVEEMYRSSSQEYVTKNTFSQLLTSCLDQLKEINTVAENARTNGIQSMQFVEAFLAAISNLQSSQPSFSLEFLIGLSGERQKEQISRAISDALQNTISKEIELSSSRMRSVIESVNEDVKREMTITLHEIREQISEHGKELGEEVFRNTEISMKSIQDISKQMDRQKRMLEAELSATREAQQVQEIEQSEARLALQRLEDTVSKLQTMSVPAMQRNHKSLVDEVIRIEGEQASTSSHMEDLDKSIARVNAQLKHITKTTAALEANEMKNRESVVAATTAAAALSKESKAVVRHADFIPESCKACEVSQKRLVELEESVQSLSAATETVQSTMDILQAELGNMSKEGEKKTLKLEKFQADFIIHKAGVTDMKKSIQDIKTNGCPVAKENQTKLTALQTLFESKVDAFSPPTKPAGGGVKVASSSTSLKSPTPGPTNALVDAIAKTKTLISPTSDDKAGDKTSVDPIVPSQYSSHKAEVKKVNKVPPVAAKEVCSPPPSKEKSTVNPESKETVPIAKATAKPVPTLLSVKIDEHKDDDDDDDDHDHDDEDHLSEASDSPKKMTASCMLADSLDESLNSLSGHFTHHITPVKVTHTPGERSKIIKAALSTSSGAENQGDLMIKKYDISGESGGDSRDGPEQDEDDSSDSESSFEDSEENASGDLASMLSPKRNKVTYEISSGTKVMDMSVVARDSEREEEEEEIGSRFNNLPHSKSQSNNQEDEPIEDDIGSRFDKLGNYIPVKSVDQKADQTQGQVQAPVLSGSLLGRRKGAGQGDGSSSGSLVTSTSIKNSSGNSAYSSVTSRLAAENAANRPSNQNTGPRLDNTAQCTFCLRRMPVEDVRTHMKSCELRTELCKYGCRSKVLVIKMDKHLDICPKNPENMNK